MLLDNQACPNEGEAYSIRTGPATLKVEAAGDWKAIVDQQVSTPLDEALPAGADAKISAQGPFYNVEKSGEGTAKLFSFPGGRRVLRFENFKVTNNVDLFVWLSQSPHPDTSAESISANKFVLGNLKSTNGNQNYEIPQEVGAEFLRSVIIWCEPVSIAYSAASLAPER